MSLHVAIGLGGAQALDYAVQMLLPMLLVRELGAEGFGAYRALWLVALTAAALLSFNLPSSLVYWTAQRPVATHASLAGNVLAYLVVAGLLAGGVLVVWPPAGLQLPWGLAALFSGLWLVSLPFDHIAIAAGRPATQARLALLQSLARLLLIGGAALALGLAGVCWALVAFALARSLVCWRYAATRLSTGALRIDTATASAQARYALAFGLGASLFALRAQADGWVAAALMGVQGVAAVSVAATVVPLIGLVRQAIVGATVSRLAQAVSQARLADAVAIAGRGNLGTALCVFPLVGGFVAVAPDAIALLYTHEFHAAGGAARLFAMTQVLLVLETSPLVQALGHGRFVMATGAALLALGVAVALCGAMWIGLGGIPLGALAAGAAGCAANLALLARVHRVPARDLVPLRLIGPLLLLTGAASMFAAAIAAPLSPGGTAASISARLLPIAAGLGAFALAYAAGAALLPRTRAAYAAAWHRLRAHGPHD